MRSVVLATCQGEPFLLAQLEGILSQLSAEDEVIISDDNSTDGTLAVVRGISDPRIQVIANTKRVGYVANFERAIARARGEVIFFSDQDDIWLPNKVAEFDSALSRTDCVASDAIVVDEELHVLHESFFRLRGADRFDDLSIYRKPKI
ncbi:MAG: glycosyltransferase, partial [Acetobacteraceae bacterium]